jgi:hypothetical protein
MIQIEHRDRTDLPTGRVRIMRVELDGRFVELAIPHGWRFVTPEFSRDGNRARLVHADGDDGETTGWVEMLPTPAVASP